RHLVVSHLLDIAVEGLGCLEEGLELGATPEALHMSFGRVPLDADDLLVGLVNAAGGLAAAAVRGPIQQRAGTSIGVVELVGAARLNPVADVLDDHGSPCRSEISAIVSIPAQPRQRFAVSRNRSEGAYGVGIRAGGLDDLRAELRRVADSDRIPALRRALQVERGGYGEGDTIIGVSVPRARAIAR